jgi:glycosyltransferase involved in cell wall biosynthesis
MSPKVSIIIPFRDQPILTLKCFESIEKNTKVVYEIIAVDDHSTSETVAIVSGFLKGRKNCLLVRLKGKEGFPCAINLGIEKASAACLVLLNNDTLVPRFWLSRLLDCLERSGEKLHLDKVGLVGPVSNYAAGIQGISNAKISESEFEAWAERYFQANRENWVYTNFLSGFCLLFKRAILDDIGFFDERFSPGGHEDNDFLLRAKLKGWKAVVDGSVFVYHLGSQTIRNSPWMRGGLWNRSKYREKWKVTRPQKLVAMYRIKNVEKWIGESLEKTSELCDEIVVLDDGSTDRTLEIVRKFPKVVELRHYERELNEFRDRQELLEMAKGRNPDWILAIDGDEVWEEKVDRAYLDRLMNPPNPDINSYIVRYFAFWDDLENYRSDGIFGRMSNIRLFRNLPDQKFWTDHPVGFHVNSVPPQPSGGEALTNIRVLHFGYVDEKERRRKWEWYEAQDKEKREKDIGGKDYRHLVSTHVSRRRWAPKNRVSLCMITRDEEEELDDFLYECWSLMDEIIIVDTGSKDKTIEVAKSYGAKVFQVDWTDFAAARNRALSEATSEWILQMDPDERFQDRNWGALLGLIEQLETDAFLFDIANFHRDGRVTFTEMIRLFKRLPGLQYEGVVHESVELSLIEKGARIQKPQVRIDHFGYLKKVEKVRAKLEQYEALNRKQIELTPNDARPYYNLALHYLNDGKEEEGFELLLKSHKLNPNYYPARKELALVYLRKAQEHFRELQKLLPKFHAHRGFIDRALEFLDKAGIEPIVVGR